MAVFSELVAEVKGCTLCEAYLPQGVRPIFQMSPQAKILIAAQAPGRKVHESGIPFTDASGDRLREWMGISKSTFYDAEKIAILPMGFCYPGSLSGKGKSGDLPPRKECAPAWREKLLAELQQIELILVIGQYAQAYHLPERERTLTATVQSWKKYWPNALPLPHPSPRNNIWIKKNPWFESDVIPELQKRVQKVLNK